MKLIFLDMDGVMNSFQSAYWYRNMLGHKEPDWVDYKTTETTAFNNYEKQLCPLACSNLRHIMESHPDVKIIISSTWRAGRKPEFFNRLFKHFKIIKEDRVIGCTPRLNKERGYEIQDWLTKFEEDVEDFIILDDDGDMGPYCKTHHFVQTSCKTGFDYYKMEEVDKILGGFKLRFEDVKIGKPYKMFGKPREVNYFKKGSGMVYYEKDGVLSDHVYLPEGELFAEVKDNE